MNRWQEKFSLLLALGFLLALISVTASAQVTTADLVGTVRDNTGAVVRGVKVTLTNVATGVGRSVITDDNGNYIFTSLQPGRYSLTAETAGFRKVQRDGVYDSGAIHLRQFGPQHSIRAGARELRLHALQGVPLH